jgi:small subunit ribosomal protein S27
MGIFAAFEYTKTAQFRDMTEEEENWNPIKTEPPTEPEDEVKVRVWFEDNNYNDDHFDVKKREHLVGKTLAKFAQCSKRPFLHESNNDNRTIIRDSLELLGWTLFEKWDQASELIKRIENGNGISKSCLDAIHFFANKTTDNSEIKELAVSSLSKLKVVDVDISKYLNDELKASISENESELISDQLSLYNEWIRERENEVNRKMEMWEVKRREQDLEQRKQEMAREEQKLFFFENYESTEKEKQAKFRE